jgi:ankyrin repeat protein
METVYSLRAVRGLSALIALLAMLLAMLVATTPAPARVETEGGPLVFGALANGNFDSVREQVTENPELVKAHDKFDQTLLHLACAVGGFADAQQAAMPTLVKFLLEKGADPNARDRNGESPLHRATYSAKGSAEIVAALLEKGADPNLADNAGLIPLYKANTRSNGGAAKLIQNAGGRDLVQPLLQAIAASDRDEVSRLLATTPALAKVPDALKNAVAVRDATMVEVLLKNGAEANARDAKTGRTPLFEAALSGSKAIVEVLLKNGADAKALDIGQRTALDGAQQAGQWDAAVLLVKAGAKPGTRYGDRNALLEDAAAAGHLELINALLDAGEKPGLGNPLQKAIANGHGEAAKVLIARGAPLEADGDDFWGRSPLHIAALTGDVPMIELLLQKGASLNATSEAGDSALALAVKSGRRDVVEVLLQKGADPNASKRTLRPRGDQEAPDENAPPTAYSRALHYALAASRRDLVEVLAKKGAKFGEPFFDAVLSRGVAKTQALLKANPELAGAVSTQDKERGGLRAFPYETLGLTPLHLAALQGDAATARVLLEAGAKLDAATPSGRVPLQMAAASGDVATVQVLLDKGADVKIADKSGATALHFAAAYPEGSAAIAVSTLLVKSDADINAKTGTNFSSPADSGAGRGTRIASASSSSGGNATPLHLAVRQNKVALVKWLLDNGALFKGEKSVEKSVEKAAEKEVWTPLHEAARAGATETVALLLARGAEVNAVFGGHTPLHEAIAGGRTFDWAPEDDTSMDWNSIEGQNRRFWKPYLTPLQISPAARATIEVLLKNGADPLAIPPMYYQHDRLTPLDVASRARDRALTGVLVNAIKDVNAVLEQSLGWENLKITPLHRAALLGDVDAVEFLLARGADPNPEDFEGRTPLDEARGAPTSTFARGYLTRYAPPDNEAFLARRAAVQQRLLKAGARAGSGPLYDAINQDNLVLVRILVKLSPSLLKASDTWRKPLIASLGKPEIMAFLIESGADPNERDAQGYSALRHAAQRSDVASTRLLLDKGADPNATDFEGRTALAEAQTNGTRGDPVVALLREKNARDEIGINNRIRKGDLEGVKALVAADLGWARRVTDSGANTSLHVAAVYGQTEIAKLLLESGADLLAVNSDRQTPLHRAAASGKIETVTFLLDKGADVNFDPDLKLPARFGTTDAGKRVRIAVGTPLYAAIYGGNKALVSLLIERGANVNYKDVAGGTPLQRAQLHKRTEIIALLLEKGAKE